VPSPINKSAQIKRLKKRTVNLQVQFSIPHFHEQAPLTPNFHHFTSIQICKKLLKKYKNKNLKTEQSGTKSRAAI
jgi:hypothetical protein